MYLFFRNKSGNKTSTDDFGEQISYRLKQHCVSSSNSMRIFFYEDNKHKQYTK